jgi:hypothetical protein
MTTTVLKFSPGKSPGRCRLYDDPRYRVTGHGQVIFSFNSRSIFPDDTHDNYGATLDGMTQRSGDYRFFLYTDDASRVFLSADDRPVDRWRRSGSPGTGVLQQLQRTGRRSHADLGTDRPRGQQAHPAGL